MKYLSAGFYSLLTSTSLLISDAIGKSAEFRTPDKPSKIAWDICSENDKRWFYMNLPCSKQWPIATLLNSYNYRLGPGGGLNRPSVFECGGIGCICAILACPDDLNSYLTPVINSSSQIYQDITTYYLTGNASYYIVQKSPGWP